MFKIKELYWNSIQKDYVESENDYYIPKDKILIVTTDKDFGSIEVDGTSFFISKERALEIVAIMDEVKYEN